MKTFALLLILALAVFYWREDMSNRRDLESARKQIEQLTLERDQALQKLEKVSHAAAKPSAPQEASWFQKRLQEKSPLDQSSNRSQSASHH